MATFSLIDRDIGKFPSINVAEGSIVVSIRKHCELVVHQTVKIY